MPRLGLDFNAQRRAVLDNHVAATLELAARRRRGASSRSPTWCSGRRTAPTSTRTATRTPPAQIDRAAEAIGAPILVGALVDGPGRASPQHRDRLGPRDGPGGHLRQAAPGAVRPSTCRPRDVLPASSATTSTWCGRDFVAGDEVGVLDVGRRPDRRRHLLRGGLRRAGARRRRRRRRDARRPDQQRHVRLHRRERAAAGDGPAAGGRARPHRRWSPPRAASRAIVAPDGTFVRSSYAVHPGGRSCEEIAAAGLAHRGASASAPAPEWALTALGAGALLVAAAPCCAAEEAPAVSDRASW